LSQKTKFFEAAHNENFVITACTILIGLKDVTDGRKDERTDGRPGYSSDAQSILLSRVKSVTKKRPNERFLAVCFCERMAWTEKKSSLKALRE